MLEQEKFRVHIETGHENIDAWGVKDQTLMSVLANAKIDLAAPCGGKCLCGKCKVKILDGVVSEVGEGERKFLSPKELADSIRLACAVKISGNISVEIDKASSGAKIITEYKDFTAELQPAIYKTVVSLDKPTIDDQRDHLQRIKDSLELPQIEIGIDLLRKLPKILGNNDAVITVVYDKNEMIHIERGDTSRYFYGVAVDIGTTTVVAYLVDLHQGVVVDNVSELNVQKSFGGDVISRINYTIENSDGLSQLNERIIGQLNEMIARLAEKNHIDMDNMYNVSVVGNTTMLHLLLGLDPSEIAVSPFIPVVTGRMIFKSGELGLTINNHCTVSVLPGISAYVGADIVAGMISSGMLESDKPSLLIDIGTNGEVALGSRNRILCCSTAAGPAFEGANIRSGIGGVSGAINAVVIKEGNLNYTTISDDSPIGICGSGIIDAVAMLLESGVVDETGRLLNEEEIDSQIGVELSNRLIEVEDQPAFVIAYNRQGEPIVITQKDVREVQLAKAAIAAGINVLVKKMNIRFEDVEKVYLAGGFGSFMNKKNAIKIGLIPKVLEQKLEVIGNAAGTGAMIGLISDNSFRSTDFIKDKAAYVELSASPEFQEEYIDCMCFE